MSGKLVGFLMKHTEVGEKGITRDSRLKEDLGLDSFDIMNMIIEFEDEFGVRVSYEEIGSFVTVKDIEKFLKGLEERPSEKTVKGCLQK